VPLGFQVKLLRWTQNDKGEDVYEDSKALTFFPRLLTLEPESRRVIRVGTQAAAEDAELTYRLAIDEMPAPRQPGAGAQVAVQVRFAVPIFVAPKQPRISTEVLDLAVKGNELKFKLANRGNQHVKLEGLTLVEGERELATAQGWYVLAGAQRGFSIRADAACGKPGPVFLVLKGEGLDLRRDVSSLLSRCGS
jgi:fimbrial chaperone protein